MPAAHRLAMHVMSERASDCGAECFATSGVHVSTYRGASFGTGYCAETVEPEVARRYWYMDGVANGLALRHIPEVSPQQDELAGPIGRRGDQVQSLNGVRDGYMLTTSSRILLHL